MTNIRTLKTAALCLALLLASIPAWADFDQAMSYFKNRKFVEAAAEFQSLVDQSPGYADGFHMLGLSFVQMNKPDEAIENFQKAIELNGDRFEFHYNLANAYFKKRDYGKTVATLKTAEGLAGNDTHKHALFALRGSSYAALEKWGDAIEDLQKAKAIKSTPAIVGLLGQAYYNLDHQDKAVPLLKEALKANPNDTATLLRLANGLIDLGAEASGDAAQKARYAEALEYADRYQKLKPTSWEAHNVVGRAALGAKEYDRADKAFSRVLEMKPDYCYAMVNRGKIGIVQEDWAGAEKILRKAGECAPRMSVVYESLGYSLQKQDRLEEAIETYNQAKKINPKAPVDTLIETCRKNIEIREENARLAEIEKEQDKELEEERKRLEEEKRKREEWEKRRERDD